MSNFYKSGDDDATRMRNAVLRNRSKGGKGVTSSSGSPSEKVMDSSRRIKLTPPERKSASTLARELMTAKNRVSALEAQLGSVSPENRMLVPSGDSGTLSNTNQSNYLATLRARDAQIKALSYDIERYRNGSPVTSDRSPSSLNRRRITSDAEMENTEEKLKRLKEEKAKLIAEMEYQDKVLRSKDRQLELIDDMIGTLEYSDEADNRNTLDLHGTPMFTRIGITDKLASVEPEKGESMQWQEMSPAAPLSPVHLEALESARLEARQAREATARMERQVQEMSSQLAKLSGAGSLSQDEEIPVIESDSDDNEEDTCVTNVRPIRDTKKGASRKRSSTPPPMRPPPLPPPGASPVAAATAAAAAVAATAAATSTTYSPFATMLRSKESTSSEFETYLEQEGRVQMLYLWRKCSHLRSKYRDKAMPYIDAYEIYTTYMIPGGMMVSLPADIIGGVRDVLQSYGRDRQHHGVPNSTFMKAEEEALHILETKFYPQFLASKAPRNATSTDSETLHTKVEVFSNQSPTRLASDIPPQRRAQAVQLSKKQNIPFAQDVNAKAKSVEASPHANSGYKAVAARAPIQEITMVEHIDRDYENSRSFKSAKAPAPAPVAKDYSITKEPDSNAVDAVEFTQIEDLGDSPAITSEGWSIMQVEKSTELIITLPQDYTIPGVDEVHLELTALLSDEEIKNLREEFCEAVKESREVAKEQIRAAKKAQKALERKAAKAAGSATEAGAEEKKDGDEKETEDDSDEDEDEEPGEEPEEELEEGELNCDEFVELVQRLAKESGQRPMPSSKLQKVYVDADEDGNGMLDIDEFIELYKKVKKGDGPDGLSAPTNNDDLDELTVEYNIKDLEVFAMAKNEYNIFRCVYEPAIDGEAEMTVEVAGKAIRGSPFRVFIYPPPLRFSSDWMSPHNIALKDKDMVVEKTEATDFAYTCAWPSLLRDRPMLWKLLIEKLGSGCYLGIIGGDHHPHDKAYDTHDAFCWQSTASAWIAGEATKGYQGWKGFEEGDECIFMYDPKREKLMLQIPKRIPGKTYFINCGAPSSQGVRVLVNMRCFQDVRIRIENVDQTVWNEESEANAMRVE